MTTLKDFAKTYEGTTIKNITELEVVRTDVEIKEKTGQDREGKEYSYFYIMVENEPYRIPSSVIEQLKLILSKNAELKTFQVSKSGEGKLTRYTTVPIQ